MRRAQAMFDNDRQVPSMRNGEMTMARSVRDLREDEVDDASAPVPAHAGESRREFLGATAGGLVIAASGLFLPNWLADAEAREGALGGDKGGRRGKNRRGRSGKRTHGKKKDNSNGQDKPRGFGLNGIDFTILVEDAHGKTLDMQYYSASDPFGNYKIMGGDSVSTNGKQTGFNTVSTRAFVWINNRYYIEAINPFAALLEGKMGHGGRIDGSGWRDGTLATSGPLDSRFAWSLKMEMDNFTFYLSHLDTDSRFQHVKLTIA